MGMSAAPPVAGMQQRALQWSDVLLGRRKAVQSPSPTMAAWSNTMTTLRRRQKMIVHDGDEIAKQILARAHVLSMRGVQLGRHSLHRGARLFATFVDEASPIQIAIGLSLGGLLFTLLLFVLARSSSNSRRAESLHKLRGGLGDSSCLNNSDSKVDSDEFDFEDSGEDKDEQSVGAGMRQKIRRAFDLSARGQRRASSHDTHALGRRPSSIVRITSSDPRSLLSTSAMQMDLDPNGAPGVTRTASHTGSIIRRRKESGRLLAGKAHDGASSSGSSGTSIAPPSSSSRIVHTAARAAKQRRTPPQDRRLSRSDGHSAGKVRTSISSDQDVNLGATPGSPTSVFSFQSAHSGSDEEGSPWRSEALASHAKLASILRREPQFYASLPSLPDEARTVNSTYHTADSDYKFAAQSSWSNGVSTAEPDTNTAESYAGSPLPPTPPAQRKRSLPPGATYAVNSPLGRTTSAPRLGTLSADQAKALWPEKRMRLVKLREPDWRPYAEVHIRARERMEKHAEVAAQQSSRSGSPMLVASGSSVSEEGSGHGSNTTAEEEEDFWFERYSRSTAASGRDWDWRKRRARQAAALQALQAVAEGADGEGVLLSPQQQQRMLQKVLPSEPVLLNGLPHESDGFEAATDSSAVAPPRFTAHRSTSQPLFNTSYMRAHPTTDSPIQTGHHDAGAPEAVARTVPRTMSFSGSDSSPTFDLSSFAPGKRVRSFSDLDRSEADKAVSVPGRLSSLKPKGVKRMLSSRREKTNNGLTGTNAGKSALSDDNVYSNGLGMTTSDGKGGVQLAADAGRVNGDSRSGLAQIHREHAESSPDLALPLRSQMNGMAPSNGAWSSADAYGSADDTRPPGARSNSLFARPNFGMPVTAAAKTSLDEAAIPPELASMHGRFLNPFQQQDSAPLLPPAPRRLGSEPYLRPTASQSMTAIPLPSPSSFAPRAPEAGRSGVSRNGFRIAAARTARSSGGGDASPSRRNILASAQVAAHDGTHA